MSQNGRKNVLKAVSVSYSILGSLALFGGGGYWLDRLRDNQNYWLIIGLILGVIVGLYELSKLIFRE